MTIKPSLQAALNNSSPLKMDTLQKVETSQEKMKDTKKLIVEIPTSAHWQIEKMRLELQRSSIKGLVTEALNDLFIKHGYPPIA